MGNPIPLLTYFFFIMDMIMETLLLKRIELKRTWLHIDGRRIEFVEKNVPNLSHKQEMIDDMAIGLKMAKIDNTDQRSAVTWRYQSKLLQFLLTIRMFGKTITVNK